MLVRDRDFHKLMETPASKLFAIIVDQHGWKLAREIAAEAIKPGRGPDVDLHRP